MTETRFHLDKNGNPGVCKATKKACPLGGEHYDTVEEAMVASFMGGLVWTPERLAKSYGPELADETEEQTLERHERELAALEESRDKSNDLVIDGTTIIARTTEEHEDRLYELQMRHSEELRARQALPAPEPEVGEDLDPWDDGFEPRTVAYGEADWDPWLDELPDDEFPALDEEPEDEVQALIAGELEQVGHDREALERHALGVTRESIEENKKFFNEFEPELAMACLDQATSVEIAEAYSNVKGAKVLYQLADHLEVDLREAKKRAMADGTYSSGDFLLEERTIMGLKHLINPNTTGGEGRRGRRSGTVREIPPELIQALRMMYLKKYGVDPFEQGVSVGELLAMLNKGELR